jgi:response regulator RpfG family c-di-GMP phosphodiesterase/DNA-binding SARP family transcriptional activator
VQAQPFHVLIIEDDPHLRQVLQTLLVDEGYSVAAAASGEEALEQGRDVRFDLIVADIRMPGIDGLETVQHLRSADPNVNSLVMTGYASEEDPIRALHIGVQAYLRKPFSLDDFLVRVSELAQKTRAAREQQLALERMGSSLHWALRRTLTEGVRAGTRTITDLVALVGELARALGVRSGDRYPPWLECAALVACLRRYGLGGARVADEPDWPEPVEDILAGLDERWDGQGIPDGLSGEEIPVSCRLVALALRLWEAGYRLGNSAAAEIEKAEPGRYDPTMLRAACSHLPSAPPSEQANTGRLLSLAAILLEKGAYRQVRELYREVLSTPSLASQRSEALLGMTQVALGENIVSEALQYARQLMSASEGIGPLTRATSLLRLGIVLGSRQLDAGVDCLRQAHKLFQSARYGVGTTETALALSHFGGQLLETSAAELIAFFQNDPSARWLRTNSWIVACLLERCAEDAVVRRVMRTVQSQYPDLLNRLQPTLSDVGQHRLTALLEVPAESGAEILTLQVFSLATFEVFYNGRRIDERHWPTQKVKYLTARLFLDLGRPLAEDVLIEDFWSGEVEKGKRNLSWSLTQLRRLLRDLVGDAVSVQRRGNSVVLTCTPPPWHDASELMQLLDKADTGDITSESCAAVLSLYRGSYLPEHYADWAVSVRERLDSRVSAFFTRALQNPDLLAPALRSEMAFRLLEVDPCHQPACMELMLQAINTGRPEEATRLFKRTETRLRSDLGVEPDLKLMELFYRAKLGIG